LHFGATPGGIGKVKALAAQVKPAQQDNAICMPSQRDTSLLLSCCSPKLQSKPIDCPIKQSFQTGSVFQSNGMLFVLTAGTTASGTGSTRSAKLKVFV